MTDATFFISVETEVTLSVADIWPDGDAPDNPTTADVQELVRRLYDSESRFLREWNLDSEFEVSVSGPGGSKPLFGFLARREHAERAS